MSYQIVTIAGQMYEVRPISPQQRKLYTLSQHGPLSVQMHRVALRNQLSPISFANAMMRLIDPDDILTWEELLAAVLSPALYLTASAESTTP